MASRRALVHPSEANAEAVSDVIGSILLVGLTVGMTVVLALLLLTYQGPKPAPQAHLAITVRPGSSGWGTGDESVVVRHLGGDAVGKGTHILLTVGSTRTDLSGAALGSAFADGKLTVGESWTRTMSIAGTDAVAVTVVGGGESPLILASASLVPLGGSA